MATASPTKPKAPRKSKAPSVCQLVLFIEGVSYHVKPIDPGFHHKAFQLRKPDGTLYHVSEGENGAECSCPSGCWRPDAPCRHLLALAACTLIGPLPGREATPEPPTATPKSRPGVDRVRDEFDDPCPSTGSAAQLIEPDGTLGIRDTVDAAVAWCREHRGWSWRLADGD